MCFVLLQSSSQPLGDPSQVEPGTSGEENVFEHDMEDTPTQTGSVTDGNETRRNTPDVTLAQHDPRPYGKKRKAAVDPLETSIQQFLASKTQRLPEDPLLLWSKNLAVSMRDLKLKRRKRLRLDIDDLLSKALRDQLDSDRD